MTDKTTTTRTKPHISLLKIKIKTFFLLLFSFFFFLWYRWGHSSLGGQESWIRNASIYTHRNLWSKHGQQTKQPQLQQSLTSPYLKRSFIISVFFCFLLLFSFSFSGIGGGVGMWEVEKVEFEMLVLTPIELCGQILYYWTKVSIYRKLEGKCPCWCYYWLYVLLTRLL